MNKPRIKQIITASGSYKSCLMLSCFLGIIAALAPCVQPDEGLFIRPDMFVTVFRFVFFSVLIYAVLSGLLVYSRREKIKSIPLKPCKVTACCFIFILLCWLPYFIKLWPGSIPTDTATMLSNARGLSDNSNNPLLTQLIYTSVMEAGLAAGHFNVFVGCFCLLQAVTLAAELAYGTGYLLRKGAGMPAVVPFLLLFAFLPLFPYFAFSMVKDSFFSTLLLPYVFLLMEWTDNHEMFFASRTKALLMCLLTALMAGVRNGAGAICILCSVAMLLSMYREKRKTAMPLILSLLAILSSVAMPLAARSVYGDTPHSNEMLSAPVQQMGYVFKNCGKPEDYLNDEELSFLRSVIDTDNFRDYNPVLSDPIKDNLKKDMTAPEILRLLGISVRLAIREPTASVKAFVLSNSAYWVPGQITEVKTHIFLQFSKRLYRIDDRIPQYPNTENARAIMAADSALSANPMTRLLQGAGLYTWLLIAAVYLATERQKRRDLIFMLPLIFVFIGCCLSPVNGYFRYSLPLVMAVPFVLAYEFVSSDKEKMRKDG